MGSPRQRSVVFHVRPSRRPDVFSIGHATHRSMLVASGTGGDGVFARLLSHARRFGVCELHDGHLSRARRRASEPSDPPVGHPASNLLGASQRHLLRSRFRATMATQTGFFITFITSKASPPESDPRCCSHNESMASTSFDIPSEAIVSNCARFHNRQGYPSQVHYPHIFRTRPCRQFHSNSTPSVCYWQP